MYTWLNRNDVEEIFRTQEINCALNNKAELVYDKFKNAY